VPAKAREKVTLPPQPGRAAVFELASRNSSL
jgi:hypothetical protein